ncbi:MAG: efflux RND transporter periplasmic adaptor subunit [Rhodocyclaceae bacterium]|nr:MAG: efflux RND transporter periplasmic adaptor subunit [Rhodocyclaceae bacterium]
MSASPIPRRVGLIVMGLLLLVAFGFVVLRSGPLAPIQVTVVQVEEGVVSPALFGIGTVEARRAYVIGPTSAGRVLKVLVDVGESVMAGQLLAEMEPVDLNERGAALDASIARAMSGLAVADAQRQDALARHQLAGINARRYIDLGEKKFVSVGTIDAKLLELTSAQAAIAAADANLAGARQEVTRLKAERDGLNRQRHNLRLVAPGDGVITSRDAEPGSTVVAGQAVIRLVDPTSLWVKLRLDQGRSGGLSVGLPAEIVLRSTHATIQRGKVARLELLSDSVTEERVAQVTFDQIPASASLGELAEVTLSLPATASGLMLPNASIKRQGNTVGVWLVEEEQLRFAEVRLDRSSLHGKVRILAGLKPGNRVVVHSEMELAVGSNIKIVESLAGTRS